MSAYPTSDRSSRMRDASSLNVHLLGLVDFDAVLAVQRHLGEEVVSTGHQAAHLVLCEHPPGISIGREGSRADLLVDEAELRSRQISIRWVSRGGATWVHLPGQLAAYLVIPVDRRRQSPGAFRTALLRALQGTAADQRVAAWRSNASPGLATRYGQVGFVGAAIRDGVSAFGCVLNVSTPPEALELIRWRTASERVSCLAAARMRPLDMAGVRESLIRRLARALDYSTYHLFTGHPLLTRTTRTEYVFR
jgi:lipoyl(octanoyl) transferase